jgi:hypothetical protein
MKNNHMLQMSKEGKLKNKLDFPSFGEIFAEVNKRYSSQNKSINQQCRLTYDILNEWFLNYKKGE